VFLLGIFRRAPCPSDTRGHPCALLLSRGRPWYPCHFEILEETLVSAHDEKTWPWNSNITARNSPQNPRHLPWCPPQWGTGVKTKAKGGADAQLGGKTMNATSHTSWKSHDVVPNASFTRNDISHCSVDVAVITELCISAAYQISSSGSSLPWYSACFLCPYLGQEQKLLCSFHTKIRSQQYMNVPPQTQNLSRHVTHCPQLFRFCSVRSVRDTQEGST
jgi:hypothetical protein